MTSALGFLLTLAKVRYNHLKTVILRRTTTFYTSGFSRNLRKV
jgi:hypothetical protein